MPTYGYRCEANGHQFEVFQSMTDDPLSKCQICGSPVRRIFYPVGIVFKGPGFYKTDSRVVSPSPVTAAPSDKADSGGTEVAPPTRDKSDRAGKSDSGGKSDPGGTSESKPKKETKAKSAGERKSA